MGLANSVVLSLVGVSTAACFGYVFGKRAEIKRKEHDFKLVRYKATMILMITKLGPTLQLEHLHDVRHDISSMEDLDNELHVEYLYCVLFASDAVVRAFGDFIKHPTNRTFVKAVASMRRDLWGRKTSASTEEIDRVVRVHTP